MYLYKKLLAPYTWQLVYYCKSTTCFTHWLISTVKTRHNTFDKTFSCYDFSRIVSYFFLNRHVLIRHIRHSTTRHVLFFYFSRQFFIICFKCFYYLQIYFQIIPINKNTTQYFENMKHNEKCNLIYFQYFSIFIGQ